MEMNEAGDRLLAVPQAGEGEVGAVGEGEAVGSFDGFLCPYCRGKYFSSDAIRNKIRCIRCPWFGRLRDLGPLVVAGDGDEAAALVERGLGEVDK